VVAALFERHELGVLPLVAKPLGRPRDLQKTLRRRGLTLTTTADEASTGPASLMLLDPDGNPILPAPKK
jgi:hypothetical protein